ncbi:MAG: primosomal protein N' [Planctomycetota bacterium]|nr:primosomal protein N' [Planctomycetota bacterium]
MKSQTVVKRIAEVAVNVPLSRPFHYEVPEELREALGRGHRVLIPFGPRTTTGVCVGFPDESEVERLKPITRVLHPECRFDDHILELTRWIADYYRASWGEVLEAALPPSIRSGRSGRRLRRISAVRPAAELTAEAERIGRRAPARARLLEYLAGRRGPHPRSELLRAVPATAAVLRRALDDGWAAEEVVEERVDPYAEELDAARPPGIQLQSQQLESFEHFLEARREGGFQPLLLHGVTGSGKTEVYLRALQEILDEGGRGLVLVPEISLTPQTVRRFREALPETPIAILHSMLSPAQRSAQWRDIQEGRARLIIGARSAAFAPVPDLGLIVVDEEHESSYKQESSPRYHARDVAVMRAKLLGIPIILGSATPSLESARNSRNGKYRLAKLSRRATRHDLPAVNVVPLDPTFYQNDGKGLVTRQLDHLIRQRLRDGEQVLIYLNRRGFATYLHCLRCGFVLRCDHCDVTLTYHHRQNLVRCHYCGSSREPPTGCPDCGMPGPKKSGVGTEKVLKELERRYPEARIARLDRDAVTTLGSLRATLSAFGRGEYDILVGTQMVAKGHNFPGVSLVGILLADTALHFPDFRAAERTFQLITQVAGRAGRGERRGRVVVQTFFPDHYAIECAARGDYDAFYDRETEFRRTFGYPPFGRLVKVVLSSNREDRLKKAAERLGACLRDKAPPACQVLGPVTSPISRIQERHRMQVLLKARGSAPLQKLLRELDEELSSRRGVDIAVDVDPQSML